MEEKGQPICQCHLRLVAVTQEESSTLGDRTGQTIGLTPSFLLM